jgi:hypothetical protein
MPKAAYQFAVGDRVAVSPWAINSAAHGVSLSNSWSSTDDHSWRSNAEGDGCGFVRSPCGAVWEQRRAVFSPRLDERVELATGETLQTAYGSELELAWAAHVVVARPECGLPFRYVGDGAAWVVSQ